METEKVYQEKTARIIQQKQEGGGMLQFVDNRPMNPTLQRAGEDEEDTLQGKFEHQCSSGLPHEAWHVAQQMAGRVEPTTEVGGMPVNDNVALEHEADVMGAKANSL